MRIPIPLVILLLAGCASAAPGTRTEDGPARILARAIEQAGGAEALERARGLVWDADATVHAGGRTVPISGRWAIQPPDTAVVSTYAVERGPSTMRHIVLAAPRGWLVNANGFAPMPPLMLASEREEFYFYSVMRLVPLRAPGVTLTMLPPDSTGHRGILARNPGRPDVELYVDATGRLSRIRARIHDATTGNPVVQEAWLSGETESGGVRWPRTMRLTQDGAPFFDLTLKTFRVLPAIQDTLLAGPR
jgi:hypothetical protein